MLKSVRLEAEFVFGGPRDRKMSDPHVERLTACSHGCSCSICSQRAEHCEPCWERQYAEELRRIPLSPPRTPLSTQDKIIAAIGDILMEEGKNPKKRGWRCKLFHRKVSVVEQVSAWGSLLVDRCPKCEPDKIPADKRRIGESVVFRRVPHT